MTLLSQNTFLTALLVVMALSTTTFSKGDAPVADVFDRKNLVAWCVVPFDAKKRGPEQRAQMLDRLGIKRLAYDWRNEHVETWDAELDALKRHNIELTAFWADGTLNDGTRRILALLARHGVQTQLWSMLGVSDQPTKNATEQEQRVREAAVRLRPLAEEAAKINCRIAIYNHGGWAGEPENQLAVIAHLRGEGIRNVGIVYNLHHGHAHLDRFGELLEMMKPHLFALNLNGMTRLGERPKILPLGQGELDLHLLKIIRSSGWQGPIGILNHVAEIDAEDRLRDNLEGLEWLRAQLGGESGGPRPTPRTWPVEAFPAGEIPAPSLRDVAISTPFAFDRKPLNPQQ